ncbi:MAG: gfo/Idh/MocA family oxidoreductase, partial [Alphaproteobacteria bacterium]
MIDMMINLAGPIAEVTVRSLARALTNGMDDTTAGLFSFASGATGCFATLAYAPRVWRVALDGTDAALELNGHERLSLTPR